MDLTLNNYKDTFNFIGNISSIIGLIITLFVLVKLRKITIEFLFKIRTPALLKKLKDHDLNISKLLNDPQIFSHDIKRELIICNVTLKSLEAKSPREIRKIIKVIRDKIRNYMNRTYLEPKIIKQIHNEIGGLIEEIQYYIKDDKWRLRK